MFLKTFVLLILSSVLLRPAEKLFPDHLDTMCTPATTESMTSLVQHKKALIAQSDDLCAQLKKLAALKQYLFYTEAVFRAAEGALTWRVSEILAASGTMELWPNTPAYDLQPLFGKTRLEECEAYVGQHRALTYFQTAVNGFVCRYKDPSVDRKLEQLMDDAEKHIKSFADYYTKEERVVLAPNQRECTAQNSTDHAHYMLSNPGCLCPLARSFRREVLQKTGVNIPDLTYTTKTRTMMAAVASTRAYFISAGHHIKAARSTAELCDKIDKLEDRRQITLREAREAMNSL